MTTTIKIGDKLRNNDPRKNGEIVTVTGVVRGSNEYVTYRAWTRKAKIACDRIFTDGKDRHQGYNLLVPKFALGDRVRILPRAEEYNVPSYAVGRVDVITEYRDIVKGPNFTGFSYRVDEWFVRECDIEAAQHEVTPTPKYEDQPGRGGFDYEHKGE